MLQTPVRHPADPSKDPMPGKRLVFALLIVGSLLAGCAAGSATIGSSGYKRCDRNGDQEERTACNR